ncbi:hypothetical protein ABKN59_011864 [Abortiporus biennis]
MINILVEDVVPCSLALIYLTVQQCNVFLLRVLGFVSVPHGTWYFMSILLARHKQKVHSILDDLESCFWVLLYVALHRFKNDADRSILKMFDEMNG